MSHLFASALPTYHHLTPAIPLSPAAALTKLQTYLKATETQPHFRPDAIFTDHAITTSIPTAEGGIVLHQLRRVESALQGVRLQSSITVDLMPFSQESAKEQLRYEQLKDSSGYDIEKVDGQVVDDSQPVDQSYNEQMLAQEESGMLEGEIGERNNVILDEGQLEDAGNKADVETARSLKRKAAAVDGEVLSKEEKSRLKKDKRSKAKQSAQLDLEAEAQRRKTGDDVRSNEVKRDEAGIQHQVDLPEANDPRVDLDGDYDMQKGMKTTHEQADEELESVDLEEQQTETSETKPKKKKHKVNGSHDALQVNGTGSEKKKKKRKSQAGTEEVPASSQISLGEIAKDSPLAHKRKKKANLSEANGT